MARTSKIGKHATKVKKIDDTVIVRYHETDIVKFNPTHITLCTGGWNTASTARRLNQVAQQFALPFGVSVRGGKRAGAVQNNILAKSKDPNGARLWVTYGNGVTVSLSENPYTFERVNPLPLTAAESMYSTDTENA